MGTQPPPSKDDGAPNFRQTAGWIKMPLGTDGLPPKRGTGPQISVHVYCGQTAEWMKTPYEVDLGQGHTVLDGDLAPRERGTAAPLFSIHVYCGRGRPSQLLLSSCF